MIAKLGLIKDVIKIIALKLKKNSLSKKKKISKIRNPMFLLNKFYPISY